MPIPDPRAGKTFIWLITCFLFLVILAGGGCLLLYMILPPSPSTSWLPILGVALVCLPWFFWGLTFFYRIISRACGFRMVIGSGGVGGAGAGAGAGGEGGEGGGGGANVSNTTGDMMPEGVPAESPEASPESSARHVHFGAEVVVHGQNDLDNLEGINGKPKTSRSSSSSSNDNSVHSHESEMPLAFSMAS